MKSEHFFWVMETVALLFQSFTGEVGFHHFGESIGQLGSGVYPVQSNPFCKDISDPTVGL